MKTRIKIKKLQREIAALKCKWEFAANAANFYKKDSENTHAQLMRTLDHNTKLIELLAKAKGVNTATN